MSDRSIEQALEEVLAGDELTRHFHYRDPSDTAVPVAEVREQVRTKVGPISDSDLADGVDAAVQARGGEKLEVLDFGKEVKDLGRRLIGQSPDPDEEMYLLPAEEE